MICGCTHTCPLESEAFAALLKALGPLFVGPNWNAALPEKAAIRNYIRAAFAPGANHEIFDGGFAAAESTLQDPLDHDDFAELLEQLGILESHVLEGNEQWERDVSNTVADIKFYVHRHRRELGKRAA